MNDINSVHIDFCKVNLFVKAYKIEKDYIINSLFSWWHEDKGCVHLSSEASVKLSLLQWSWMWPFYCTHSLHSSTLCKVWKQTPSTCDISMQAHVWVGAWLLPEGGVLNCCLILTGEGRTNELPWDSAFWCYGWLEFFMQKERRKGHDKQAGFMPYDVILGLNYGFMWSLNTVKVKLCKQNSDYRN